MSSLGNNYVLVLYHVDTNAILAEGIKERTKGSILKGYRSLHSTLLQNGSKPQLQVLDNEVSHILLDYMKSEKIDIQLAPPHMHRTNLAERAIRTYKEHFVALRALCHKDFPHHLWCRLIQQAVITLNLLRPLRLHPLLSAHSVLYGVFDYNKTPLAPPGTKVLVHEKPKQNGTWADHGIEGWYIRLAPNHYRCYKCYLPSTNGERISDTVEFFPTHVDMPKFGTAEQITQSLQDLTFAINNPAPASPFHEFGPIELNALKTLADIYHTNTPIIPADDTPPPRVPIITQPIVNTSPTASPSPRVET